MKNKKGISLIVIIITIIVVIILAAVVILTLSKNNPIESAKEARFKEDVRTFQDELAMTVSKQYAQAGGKRDEKISTSDFEEIKEYIPSFSEKYRSKFVIQDDELWCLNIKNKEENWCKSLNINLLYREVEYIESTGEQWIDTLIIPTEDLKLIIDFTPLENTGGYLLGCLEIDQRITYRLFNPYGLLYFDFNGREWGYSLSKDERVNIELHNYYVLRNGITVCSDTRRSNLKNSKTIYLFGGNSTKPSPSKSRVYSCIIYNGEEIERDYIPILDYNNKPALYDKVEGKFYYNQGTGEDFIAGPDVD